MPDSGEDPDAGLFLDLIETPETIQLAQHLFATNCANHTNQPSDEPALIELNTLLAPHDVELVRRLGSGASSCVYELRVAERRFAFKLGYKDGSARRECYGERIGEIWEDAARYFTKVYAVREWSEEVPLASRVVMQMVGDGVSLQALINSDQLPRAGSSERIAWARRVGAMIADGMIYMNKAQVYHGDLKADNLIVEGGTEPIGLKIIDWEQAVTANSAVGVEGYEEHWKPHMSGCGGEKMAHIHKQTSQVLMGARCIAAAFCDFESILNDEQRWRAPDGVTLPREPGFGDPWRYHGSLLMLSSVTVYISCTLDCI